MVTETGQSRTKATRQSMMRALEKLGAEHGLENVTVKAILKESGQKNVSALQYHFGSRQGLIEAVFEERTNEIRTRRGELFRELLAQKKTLSMREIWGYGLSLLLCWLESIPTFVAMLRHFP